MANIFGAFSNYGNFATVGKYIGYSVIGLLVCLSVTAIIVMLIVKLKERPIYVIDLVSRRITKMRGREKKTRSKEKSIYVSKIKKYLPQIQQQDRYIQGKNDAFILIKDNNGLYHSARVPKWGEFLKNVVGVEEDEVESLKENPKLNRYYLDVRDKIYFAPNPVEDLEWLADQAAQAKTEFSTAWWKHPNVMIIATAFICAIMIIMTAFISKRM